MHPFEVLRRPVITEKTTLLQESGKYVFEIAAKANKLQVKEAVEKTFEVKVLAVNIIRTPGERKRIGMNWRDIGGMKKAVVTLGGGETIQLFEGA